MQFQNASLSSLFHASQDPSSRTPHAVEADSSVFSKGPARFKFEGDDISHYLQEAGTIKVEPRHDSSSSSSSSEDEDQELVVGNIVRIHKLKKAKDLNGAKGQVKGFEADREGCLRVVVLVM